MRRIPFSHMLNLRDLGGYPTKDGKLTKEFVFLRGDAPVQLVDIELQFLLHHKITTIIDLRSPEEVKRNPNALCVQSGFSCFSIPLLGSANISNNANNMGEFYFQTANEKRSIAKVMHCIAEAENGVLFHCTAGKDRTGIIAAFLLSLAGVKNSDIIADYQVSYTYIKPLFLTISRDYPDLPAYVTHSDAEYMEYFLSRIEQEYGDVSQFLINAGVSNFELNRIQNKFKTKNNHFPGL